MGDVKGASDYQHRGLAIAEALYARNPSGAAERRALAIAYHHAGDVMITLNDYDGALDSFVTGIARRSFQ